MHEITVSDFLMGREVDFPPTPQMLENAAILLAKVNELLDQADADGVPTRLDQVTGARVSSGYRPTAINDRTANAAKKSAHLTCEAIDVADTRNQDLARWCLKHLDILQRLGLFAENPRWTFSIGGACWVHLQTRPTKSGQTVFIPSAAPPRGPEL